MDKTATRRLTGKNVDIDSCSLQYMAVANGTTETLLKIKTSSLGAVQTIFRNVWF
jgi:hypothetical protein